MPYDLSAFALADMLHCTAALRRAMRGVPTIEDAARAIVRVLHESFADPASGERQCALVRFFVTQPYARLDPELQALARRRLGVGHVPSPRMRCLTLLASAGARPEWNSRATSRQHRVIPLASVELVERTPMVAQLLLQFGCDVRQMVDVAASPMEQHGGRTFNVFHVLEATGSPYIPEQLEFVRPFDIRSAVGFGGPLASGELFAVLLFSRAPVPHESAERFRAIALAVKAGIFFMPEDRVFRGAAVPLARGNGELGAGA